jgi:hypothetical protein
MFSPPVDNEEYGHGDRTGGPAPYKAAKKAPRLIVPPAIAG